MSDTSIQKDALEDYEALRDTIIKHLGRFVHDDDVAEVAILIDAIEKAGKFISEITTLNTEKNPLEMLRSILESWTKHGCPPYTRIALQVYDDGSGQAWFEEGCTGDVVQWSDTEDAWVQIQKKYQEEGLPE